MLSNDELKDLELVYRQAETETARRAHQAIVELIDVRNVLAGWFEYKAFESDCGPYYELRQRAKECSGMRKAAKENIK